MRVRILAVLAVAAINIGIVGVVVATSTADTAAACVTTSGALKLQHNGSCGSMSRVDIVTTDYPGAAKAYAHVMSGVVDSALSWNVDAGDLYYDGNGGYCFRNLDFTPRHAQVTLEYWGLFNGDVPMVSVSLPPNQNTDCGLAELPQLFLFTGLENPTSGDTDGARLNFYIVIY